MSHQRTASSAGTSGPLAEHRSGPQRTPLLPRSGHQHPVVLSACVLHSSAVITVLLRYEHHMDHTFLQATHYQDQGGVLTVHRGEEEVARFPAGSWDGVYRYDRNRVREPDGGERAAKGLEVELGGGSGST